VLKLPCILTLNNTGILNIINTISANIRLH